MTVPSFNSQGYFPSRSVPPLSISSFWPGMKSITLCGAASSNSPELAPASPALFRAYSITAICIPRQIPKYGM